MDLTIPLVLGLQTVGNGVFFAGLFELLSLTVFKANGRETKEPDIEKVLEEVSKEIGRM